MIPFNKAFITGREIAYISRVFDNAHLSGDGPYTKICSAWLEDTIGCGKALLTHSCTAALEMSALLANLTAGDEVIMPSFTFVSTANAFVLRGVVPVFVDIRPDTMNIDETLIEALITQRTKAICVVHYAGVACEMDQILDIAKRHGLLVIEDAAQGIQASYKGKQLGSMGDLSALSFHETKNLISGEGGALLVNDPTLVERAEILREKGTNRSRFFRGQIDKYTWVDLGSSYLPSELIAAFLAAQIEDAEAITRRRLDIWQRYSTWAARWEDAGMVRRPVIPPHCVHNAHIFYLLLPDCEARARFIAALKANGIGAVFHYIPLHSSPAGRRFGRTPSPMPVTNSHSARLVRMPLWVGLEDHMDHVLECADAALADLASQA